MKLLHTVVQLDEFVRRARALMPDEDRERIVDYMAAHPGSGDALGGGLWKVRVARPGGGKRGGFRVIYLFTDERIPVFLLSIFAKNMQADLGRKEQALLIEFGKALVANYGVVR